MNLFKNGNGRVAKTGLLLNDWHLGTVKVNNIYQKSTH